MIDRKTNQIKVHQSIGVGSEKFQIEKFQKLFLSAKSTNRPDLLINSQS